MAGHNVSAVREAVVSLCLFGIVLTFISIVGTEWAVPPEAGTGEGSDTFQGVGLWKYCFRQESPPGSDHYAYVCRNLVGGSDVPGWMTGVQTVTLLAVVFYAFAFVAIISFTCCGSRRHDKRLLVAFVVLETVAGIFNLTGVVLFSEQVHSSFANQLGLVQLAWCFVISCTADALALVTVILAAVEFYRSKDSTVPMQRFVNEMNAQPTSSPPSGNGTNQPYETADETAGYNQTIPTLHLSDPNPSKKATKETSDSTA